MSDTDSELTDLLSSAGIVFLGISLNRAVGLAEYVVLGRALSTDAYGAVTIGLTLLSLSTTVALVGFRQGIPRFMSRMETDRERRGVWATGLGVAGIAAAFVATPLYLGVDLLATRLFSDPSMASVLRPFVLAIPMLVGFHVGVAAIRGLERTVYKTLVSDLLYPLGRIGIVLALLSLGYGAQAAGYSYLIMAVGSVLVAHLLLHRLVPLIGRVNLKFKRMVTFSAPLVVASVLSMLLMQTDTLMMGYFHSSYETGLYGYIYPISTGLLFVISAFGFLYLPLTSRLDANDERERLSVIYRVTTKWIYLATFPLFLTLTVFPADVLVLLFGPQATPAAPALVVLSAGFFINAVFGRNHDTITALGAPKLVLVSNAAAFGLNICLNLYLIPRYSYVGAAVASAVAYTTLNVIDYALLRRQFDITPFTARAVRTYLVVPLLLVPPAVLFGQLVTLTPVNLLMVVALYGLLTIMVAAACGCFRQQDALVLDIIESKLGRPLPVVRRILKLPE